MNQPKHLNLPSRKSVEDAVRVYEGFRDLCRHQLDAGYWATVDFPSKHHLNRLLQFSWRNPQDLEYAYGEGLVRRVFDLLPSIKAYTTFTRDPNEKTEAPAGKVSTPVDQKRIPLDSSKE